MEHMKQGGVITPLVVSFYIHRMMTKCELLLYDTMECVPKMSYA